jgi:hypothetical protein
MDGVAVGSLILSENPENLDEDTLIYVVKMAFKSGLRIKHIGGRETFLTIDKWQYPGLRPRHFRPITSGEVMTDTMLRRLATTLLRRRRAPYSRLEELSDFAAKLDHTGVPMSKIAELHAGLLLTAQLLAPDLT